jgi:hypothetical protein
MNSLYSIDVCFVDRLAISALSLALSLSTG